MPGFRDILAQLMAGGGGSRPATATVPAAPVGRDEYQTLLDRELQRYGDRDQAVRSANIAGGFGNSTAQQFMHPAAAAAADPMQTAAVPTPAPRPDLAALIPPIPTPRPVELTEDRLTRERPTPLPTPRPGTPPALGYGQMASSMGEAGVPHIGLSPAMAESQRSPVPVPTPRPKRAKKRSQYRLRD